jgi:hypothetical protein
MGMASYKIMGCAGEWHIEHDGKALNTYATKSRLSKPPLLLPLSLSGRVIKSSSRHRARMMLLKPPRVHSPRESVPKANRIAGSKTGRRPEHLPLGPVSLTTGAQRF